jgi:hypothetical protein
MFDKKRKTMLCGFNPEGRIAQHIPGLIRSHYMPPSFCPSPGGCHG